MREGFPVTPSVPLTSGPSPKGRGERIRIRTPSRLHFGLFSLPSANATLWVNHEGEATLPRRQFGGVGLMIDRPGIELVVEPALTWSSDGPLAERALRFAQMYCDAVGVHDKFHLGIEAAPPEHVGLGTGTQLALAVAQGIAELTRADIAIGPMPFDPGKTAVRATLKIGDLKKEESPRMLARLCRGHHDII